MSRPLIGVIGPGEAPSERELELAAEVGRAVAQAGAVLLCGGLGGVMEAASRGAREAGGLVVGILPGPDRRDANPHVDVALATNLGPARNVIIATAADALVAVGGKLGTLSEMAFGLRMGKRVVSLESFRLDELGAGAVVRASSPEDAVRKALLSPSPAGRGPGPTERRRRGGGSPCP